MNKKNTQKPNSVLQSLIKNLTKNPSKALSIIGVGLLLVIGIMVAKVDPSSLQASFFSRFFDTDLPEEPTENTTETSEENTLGFYRFQDIQSKYFPVPDTNNLSEAVNYEATPATFFQAQQVFNNQFEQTIATMITSSTHLDQTEAQFARIQDLIKNIHIDLQPQVIDLATKVCHKQDADGAECE